MLSVVIALNIMLNCSMSTMNGQNPAVPLFKPDSNQVAVAVAATNKPKPSDCSICSMKQKEAFNKFITAGPVNLKIPEDWSIEEFKNSIELKKDGESVGFLVYGPYDAKLPLEAYAGIHLKKLEKSTLKLSGFHKAYKLNAEISPNTKAESVLYTHYLFIDKEQKNYILISSDGTGPYAKAFESIAKGVERCEDYYKGGNVDFGNADIN